MKEEQLDDEEYLDDGEVRYKVCRDHVTVHNVVYQRSSRRKRRKLLSGRRAVTAVPADEKPTLSLQPLIDQLSGDKAVQGSFDEIIDRLLPDYLDSRARLQQQEAETDRQSVNVLRPFVELELTKLDCRTRARRSDL
jgi:hypothetical protein